MLSGQSLTEGAFDYGRSDSSAGSPETRFGKPFLFPLPEIKVHLETKGDDQKDR